MLQLPTSEIVQSGETECFFQLFGALTPLVEMLEVALLDWALLSDACDEEFESFLCCEAGVFVPLSAVGAARC